MGTETTWSITIDKDHKDIELEPIENRKTYASITLTKYGGAAQAA